MINWIKSLFNIEPNFGGVARNSLWSAVRKQHLEKEPACAVCGTKGSLFKPNEVHHEIPFNLDKSQELMSSNLITLCRVHHFLFGHLGYWKSYNVDVRRDAKIWQSKILNRP